MGAGAVKDAFARRFSPGLIEDLLRLLVEEGAARATIPGPAPEPRRPPSDFRAGRPAGREGRGRLALPVLALLAFTRHRQLDTTKPSRRRVSGAGWSDWSGCSGNILMLRDKLPYCRREFGWNLHYGLRGTE